MYPPVAGGGPAAVFSEPPVPVQRAVRLMYIGAGLEILGLLFNVFNLGNTSGGAVYGIVVPLIGAGLWVWMAMMNKAGKEWARIVATVFFGLSCIGLLIALVGIGALTALGGALGSGAAVALGVLALLVTVAAWLIGLFTILFLWRKESSAYFKAMSAPSVMPPGMPPSMPPGYPPTAG